MSAPLLEFTSHIAGKNAKVQLYNDRLEWTRAGMSSGKVTAGVLTMGISTLATGIRGKETEMIAVKSISSVTSKKGIVNTTVSVIASGNAIDMKVSHGEADKLKDTLLELMAR